MDTTQQGASSNPPTPITIGFSAQERAGMQRLLGLYAACVQTGLPPSPARRDELTALTHLLENLALLETMQEGESIEIDAASLLVVQHLCAFFIAGASLLPLDEQSAHLLRAVAAEVRCLVFEAQG